MCRRHGDEQAGLALRRLPLGKGLNDHHSRPIVCRSVESRLLGCASGPGIPSTLAPAGDMRLRRGWDADGKVVEANTGCNLAAPAGLWHIRPAAATPADRIGVGRAQAVAAVAQW